MTPSLFRALVGPAALVLLATACEASTDLFPDSRLPPSSDGDGQDTGDGTIQDGEPGDGSDPGSGRDAGAGSDGPAGELDAGGGGLDGMDGTDGQPDAGGNEGDGSERCPGGDAPPETWQEHWFEHVQLTKRVYYDDCVAIYFDDDMDRQYVGWISDFVTRVWKYSLETYGYMGPGRLFATFHQGKYFGGHPSYHYSDFHDHRNSSDVGGNDWTDGNYGVTSHEVGHVVESTAAHTKFGSPAFGLWGDSKWIEFYQYDLYLALGLTDDAQAAFDRFTNTSDDFPRENTHWFRDWFYPLWRDHGHAQVMVNFFSLLEQHFPANADGHMRDMNWGEYIHFTSGAAGADLKELASNAFGWPDEWEQEWQKARSDFPQITY